MTVVNLPPCCYSVIFVSNNAADPTTGVVLHNRSTGAHTLSPHVPPSCSHLARHQGGPHASVEHRNSHGKVSTAQQYCRLVWLSAAESGWSTCAEQERKEVLLVILSAIGIISDDQRWASWDSPACQRDVWRSRATTFKKVNRNRPENTQARDVFFVFPRLQSTHRSHTTLHTWWYADHARPARRLVFFCFLVVGRTIVCKVFFFA